jgi:hypothetical protein
MKSCFWLFFIISFFSLQMMRDDDKTQFIWNFQIQPKLYLNIYFAKLNCSTTHHLNWFFVSSTSLLKAYFFMVYLVIRSVLWIFPQECRAQLKFLAKSVINISILTSRLPFVYIISNFYCIDSLIRIASSLACLLALRSSAFCCWSCRPLKLSY